MRNYSIVSSRFWDGQTGKDITKAGKDARISATYVMTNRHANLIGLYHLPLTYFMQESGLKRREIVGSLAQLHRLGFAHYDMETEFVWIVEMARHQLQLQVGDIVDKNDNRLKGVIQLYRSIPPNPFLGMFYDHYSETLRLPQKRLTSPDKWCFQGAQKGLARDSEGVKAPAEPLNPSPSPLPPPSSGPEGEGGSANSQAVNPEAMAETLFNEWWDLMPPRNGKKLGKSEARTKFMALEAGEMARIVVAARNFGNSQQVRDGIGIPDPHRFIERDRPKGRPWLDWEMQDTPTRLCQWTEYQESCNKRATTQHANGKWYCDFHESERNRIDRILNRGSDRAPPSSPRREPVASHSTQERDS